MRRWQDGKIIGESEFRSYGFGGPYVLLYRADLQSALWRVAVERGVEYRLGSRVVYVDCEAGRLILEGGEVVEADLVVAADGEMGPIGRTAGREGEKR